MSEKIYLKIDQQRYVKKPKVDIGDVMTVYCSDKDMIEKIGHILYPAASYCGKIIRKDIGFAQYPDMTRDIFTYDYSDISDMLPLRKPDGNKGTFGKALE